MDKSLLKEPAAAFVTGFVSMILFMFVESRMRNEKKPFRDYILYGVFMGAFTSMMIYVTAGGKNNIISNNVGRNYLIDRFPV